MIGIILLNYNEWDLTVDCVESIRNTTKAEYRIYIVDNGSATKATDRFQELVRTVKDIKLIRSDTNLGYAGGNNIGISRVIQDGCTECLISNNDVIFYPGCIDRMRQYLKDHPETGIVGPKVYIPGGGIQEINMGCKMTMAGKYKYILRKTPLRKLSRRFVRKFHCEEQDLKTPFRVYAVSGCCFMMSEQALKQITPLDQGTFLYEEENIIGCRMEEAGLATVYLTDAEILHIGGSSTAQSEFAYTCGVYSELYYCRKYLHAVFFAYFPLYCIRSRNFIKQYGRKNIKEYFHNTILKKTAE